jgi:hypothetical protein
MHVCTQGTSYNPADLNRFFMVQGTTGTPTVKTSSSVRMTAGYSNQVSNDQTQVGIAVFR